MFEGYEKFKKDIYAMTTIDLNALQRETDAVVGLTAFW